MTQIVVGFANSHLFIFFITMFLRGVLFLFADMMIILMQRYESEQMAQKTGTLLPLTTYKRDSTSNWSQNFDI